MRFATTTSMVLRPAGPPVPFELLLAEWSKVELAPDPCRSVLEQLVEQRNIPRTMFVPEAIASGERPATEALLFDCYAQDRDWICMIQTEQPTRQRIGVRMPASNVLRVAHALRAVEHSADVEELRVRALEAGLHAKLVDGLCMAVEPEQHPAPYGTWPRCDRPGIYRREHASLVIRSRTTTLVVDPQCLSPGESSNQARYPVDDAALDPDAIVITHQHEDHWHLPSILRLARGPHPRVIVPVTPRPNLLTTEDFAASLARAGLTAIATPWGTTTRIGDIEIDTLPFFGEQPTRNPPGPGDGVRSWGNCYRFTTPEFSALLLVDSGVDPMGSMLDVVRRSVDARGAVDVVLSNCRTFPEVVNPGLAHYAFALPFERVRAAFLDHRGGRVRSMTLGETGVAEACVAARARYFLPYAHMFAGLGVDVDCGEAQGVIRELARLGASTQLAMWNPGDVARVSEGRLWIEHP